MRTRSILVLMALTALIGAGGCLAQGSVNSTGNGGRHTIQGSIFFPGGKRPEIPIEVRLESSTHTPLTVYADKNGNFSFRSLSPGNYTIIVEVSEDFEISRDSVLIDPDVISTRTVSSSKVSTLPVYLQSKAERKPKNEILDVRLKDIPKTALKHYEKALEHTQENQLDKAIGELKAALSLYPNFHAALSEIGKLYLQSGKLKNALNSLEKAVALDSKDFESQLNFGIALLNENSVDSAEKHLGEAARINAIAVTPHYYLGIVYIKKKMLDRAQNEFEIAKKNKEESDLPLVHKYLGGIYWGKKEFARAADELEIYLKFISGDEAKQIRQTIQELRNIK